MKKLLHSIFGESVVFDDAAKACFIMCVMGQAERKELQTRLRKLNRGHVVKFDWPYETILRLRCAILQSIKAKHDVQVIQAFTNQGLKRWHRHVMTAIKELRLTTRIKSLKVEAKPDIFTGQKLLANLVKAQTSSLKKFAGWKLKFIVRYYATTLDDLVTEMQARSIIAFYRGFPYYSEAHMAGYMLRAGKNYALTIITFYTRGKRAEIKKADPNTGFDFTLTQAQAHIGKTNDAGNDMGRNDLFDLASITAETSPEDVTNYELFLRRCNKKQKQVIGLLMLQHDPKFLSWLRSNAESSAHTLPGVLRDIGVKDYMRKVRKYVGIDPDRYKEFLSLLKDETPSVAVLASRI